VTHRAHTAACLAYSGRGRPHDVVSVCARAWHAGGTGLGLHTTLGLPPALERGHHRLHTPPVEGCVSVPARVCVCVCALVVVGLVSVERSNCVPCVRRHALRRVRPRALVHTCRRLHTAAAMSCGVPCLFRPARSVTRGLAAQNRQRHHSAAAAAAGVCCAPAEPQTLNPSSGPCAVCSNQAANQPASSRRAEERSMPAALSAAAV
jgi:hypothetical protein